MGKYLESEEEKRMNYLKRKLLQWKDNAKLLSKEAAKNRIAKWTEVKYKTAVARESWRDLSGKYDMYINKYKEGIEFKKILILMRSLFTNWEERNKFLAKRFFVRKWFMQVKRMKQREAAFDKAMGVFDKQLLAGSVDTIAEACQIKRVCNAVPVARAVDFFTQLRKIWGDWEKIRRRILNIMGKYFESEEEKRINYLKRKLLQWKDNAKLLTKEAAKRRIARWSIQRSSIANARNNWKELSGKYDMFINKSYLFQLKTRLRNWLKLRTMAENLRNRFTIVGLDQYKEGIEFKKILILMRSLFTNWEERNKFLAKRFFVRKWFMQVKKMKQRDAEFEKALKEVDKKLLTSNVNALADAYQVKRIFKAVSVARAALRKDWGEWEKIRRRILAIMGKYLESEEEKRMNYLKRKLLQWKDNANLLTKEAAKRRIARWSIERSSIANARNNWKELSGKYDMYVNKSYLFQLKTRLRNWLKLRSKLGRKK